MDSLSIIIAGIVLLLVIDFFIIRQIRKKRQGSFKIVIEKGRISETKGNPPSEFLFDIQQLARMFHTETLIINGQGTHGKSPSLNFVGNINPQLRQKIDQAFHLSLQ